MRCAGERGMRETKRPIGRTAPIWLAAVTLAALVAAGVAYSVSHRSAGPAPHPGQTHGSRITVLGVWGGSELESFLAMVRPFEQRTGVTVEFEGTRDINAVLTTRVKGGNPPDIAGVPGPGQMAGLARAGALVPLDTAVDRGALKQQYAPGWIDLATVDGRLYGIFIKAALKGLVWYNAGAFRTRGYTIPRTWDELIALTDRIAGEGRTPWCIGLESGAASGWPATDWIESIMLRTAGPEIYVKWYRHEIGWTHPAVRRAWEMFGSIAANERDAYGGVQGVLAINFGESPFPLFTSPPGCYLHQQASFIQDFIQKQYPNLRPIEDLNFFAFPRITPGVPPSIEVAGDLLAMFHDTPQARALIRYLTTPEAQAIWVRRGGALSPNRRVSPREYPDPLARHMAEILIDAQTVRFDASDMMPDAVNSAFLSATMNYVQHPDRLDQILQDLERVAVDAANR
jgi:alpha-glucoside transport system substrate-binding protein